MNSLGISLYRHIALFVAVFLVVYVIERKSNPRPSSAMHALLWGIGAVLLNEYATVREWFHLEISPWKRTCSNNPNAARCPGCCGIGFNGLKLGFEYTTDAERMDNSRTCADHAPSLLRPPADSFATLTTYNN